MGPIARTVTEITNNPKAILSAKQTARALARYAQTDIDLSTSETAQAADMAIETIAERAHDAELRDVFMAAVYHGNQH